MSAPISIETAIMLMADIYKFSCVGGNAHIVTDDGNVEDEHIRWCLDVALIENMHEAGADQLLAERAALEYLLTIPLEDRESAYELLWDRHEPACAAKGEG